MRASRPDQAAGNLRRDVDRHLAPGCSPVARIGHRDDRVHVRAGYRSEGQDERHQRRARRERIREQGYRHVPASERLAHDAGPDDGRDQERGADELGDRAAGQRRSRCDGHFTCTLQGRRGRSKRERARDFAP